MKIEKPSAIVLYESTLKINRIQKQLLKKKFNFCYFKKCNYKISPRQYCEKELFYIQNSDNSYHIVFINPVLSRKFIMLLTYLYYEQKNYCLRNCTVIDNGELIIENCMEWDIYFLLDSDLIKSSIFC